jgi:hypothetical protein
MKAETRHKRYMKVEAENTINWIKHSHEVTSEVRKTTMLKLALINYETMEKQANQLVIAILEER